MRYYVYILLDDRKKGSFGNNYCELNHQPFYVGKGDKAAKNKNKRHLLHYKDAIMNNKTSKINPHKTNLIKKLINLNYEPNVKIVFESDDEDQSFKVEKELIEFYGRFINGGILTNITLGGSGGDTFTNNPNKDVVRMKHSINTKGNKNPMYGRPLKLNPSHLSKINGKHWNFGIERSEKFRLNMKEMFKNRIKNNIVVIDTKTLEEIDILNINEIIDKYKIKTKSLVYRCVTQGGSLNGYYFRYVNSELILTKTKRNDYQKPKIIRKSKTIFYKKNINSEEIEFNNVNEASEKIGFNPNVIRRKCINNNSYDDIFRYNDKDYTFDVKMGNNKKEVIRVDKYGQIIIFESLKSAADYINGKITSVLAVCKGRNKTYKGYKFEYKNK